MNANKTNFEFTNETEQRKNRSCTFIAKTWGEIRKIESEKFEIEGKVYKRLLLSLDDRNGERFYLIDKNVGHESGYKQGMKGMFVIRIDVDASFEGKTKILVTGFKED